MDYRFLVVRDAEADDDDLYPVLARSAIGVRTEQGDGTIDSHGAVVRAIVMFEGESQTEIGSFAAAKSNLTITESRVVVWCTKYDKGGGWLGFGAAGFAIAATANAVSRSRAAKRREGTCLVGQVRYPWLTSVDYSSTAGTHGRGQRLRLVVYDDTVHGPTMLAIYFHLTSSTSARRVADQAIRHAAKHRLEHRPDLDEQAVSILSRLAIDGANEAHSAEGYVSTSIPGALPARRGTAFAPSGSAVPAEYKGAKSDVEGAVTESAVGTGRPREAQLADDRLDRLQSAADLLERDLITRDEFDRLKSDLFG